MRVWRRLTAYGTAFAVVAGLGVTQGAATAAAASSSGRPLLARGDGSWSSKSAPGSSSLAWKAPAAKPEKLAKPDPHAKRVKELTDRRTADASFFQMSDGSVQEELSATPVHYKDSHGNWQDIDTTVKPVSHDGFTAGSVGDGFQTYFSPNASGLVRLEQGGASVQIGVDGASTSAPKLSGDSASYQNAYPGVDLSYQSGSQGVKESIVLAKAPKGAESFSYTLKLGDLAPKQLADGAIAFYGSESPDPVFTIPAPYMSDAKPDANSPYGLVYSGKVAQSMSWDARSGTLHLTVTPDAKWLADPHRVYPVTIDPTIVVAPTPTEAQNVMISSDGATTNYDTSWRLSVGTTTTGVGRALIKFPMPTVPAGTTITSANLELYYDQTFTTGSNTVPMQALAANTAWDPTTATWSNASSIGGPVAGTSSMAANALDVWNTYPVTSTVQSWLNGTTANNGFVVKATNESTLGQGGPRYEGSIFAYEGEVVNYPKLVITYGIPGVALNTPTVIHSTGAELSWPAYTNTTGNSGNDLAEYQIHRTVFQTFTPSSSTEISPVAAGTTSFVDSTATPTPANNSDPYGNAYYYMVVVKTKNGTLIPGPTTLVRLPEAGRTTMIVPVSSATTLSSTEPTTVLNTLSNAGIPQPWLEVGDNSPTYGKTRAVFNFPALTSVPAGSTILDAHLKLWQEQTTTNTSGAVYELHALTKPFTGTQATWNSAATGTAWTTAGGDFNATADGTISGLTNDPNRQNLDATAIVQGWVNTPSSDDGLMVKLSGEASTSPQEHTIFAGRATAEPALAPQLVITYLDKSTSSTYYAPSTPAGMNQGTSYTVPVTVNNTTASTWSASNEVLTYHWTLPDGTDVTNTSNQVKTPLPADIVPAGTTTVNAQVTPPTPSDGNEVGDYTLAWDMLNTSTNTYLSASAGTSGIGSLDQQTGVSATGNNQLGLEQFYPYTNTSTGSGSSLYTNEASGNTVWNDDLFSNPSVGFQTFLRLNYNSLDTSDTDTGFGWSIQASTPTRLGQGLGFYPPGNPTKVVLDDGTGNSHQWNFNSSTGTWTSPPGVHLYLQEMDPSCGPKTTDARAWKMTKPDRTTFYYDCNGYPTSEVDANGNTANFTYADRQSQNKPQEFLQYITDPSGIQTLNVSYYAKGSTYSYIDSTGTLQTATNLTDPNIIDHVSSMTDVSGRTVDFYYTTQGLLARIVDGAGTSVAKTFNFTYDATQGMKNVKLVAVQDPRGDTTNISYYPPSSPTKWWTQQVTDRLTHTTGFAYVQPGTISGSATTTTVTDGNTHNWVYQSDTSGRLVQEVNPLQQKTSLAWDTDNNVTTLTENNGAKSQWTYDPNTGYPLTYEDPVSFANGSNDETAYGYDTTDTTDPTLSGHIADLIYQSSAANRLTTYTYDGNGNMLTTTAPDGNAIGAVAGSYTTTYTYAPNGEVLSVKDADNHTTNYGYTHEVGPGLSVAELTGQPDSVTDAMQNTTDYAYGPRGEVTSVVDPLDKTSTYTYDVFLRPTGSQVPKDTSSSTYVITPPPVYDGDDNVVQAGAPYLTGYPTNAVTTTVYDKDDEPSAVTLPSNSTTAVSRVDSYTYDNVGNQLTSTEPLGNASGAVAGSYTTTSVYDPANELTKVTDGADDVTQYGYDDVGNATSVTDPRNFVSKTSYDLDHRPDGTTDAANHTTSVTYDPDGLKTSSTDQNNNTTYYSEDADGQLTQAEVPHTAAAAFDTTQYTYDQVGNNTSVISPRGVASGTSGAYTTSSVYNADNQLSKAFGAYLPGDNTYGHNTQPETDYSYDADGRMTTIDRITQPSATTLFVGQNTPTDHAVTHLSYYDNGWTKSSTDPFDITTAYDYNGLGEQISRTLTSSDGGDGNSAIGATARYMDWDYYPDGSLQDYTDTGSPAGWQDQVFTADSGTTQPQASWTQTQAGNGYDGSSYYQGISNSFVWNLAVPQSGNYSVYVYYSSSGDDAAKYSVAYHGGSQSNISVNQTQNVGSWVSLGSFAFTAGTSDQSVTLTASGSGTPAIADAIRIVRDNSGDTQPAANNLAYTYDVDGNLAGVSDNSPNAQYDNYTAQYDGVDRLQQLKELSGTTLKHTLAYGYDGDSNLTSQSQDSTSGAYTYNNLDQLTQVVDKQYTGDPGITTGYTYTPTGQLSTETKGNENVVTDTYNLDDTLASTSEATSTGTTVERHQLSYDPNDDISQDVATLQSADTGSALNNTANFTYDPNDQVTGVTNSNGHDNQTYLYDSSGDPIEQNVGGAQADYTYLHGRPELMDNGGLATGTYEYDTFGRLHEVVNGNWSGFTGTTDQTYNYDGFDDITSETALNPLTNSTNTTAYTYDSLARPLTETINGDQTDTIDYLGSSKTVADEQIAASGDTVTKTYDYSPDGERLAMLDEDPENIPNVDQTDYYSYDQHQNVEALTGQDGSTIGTYGYTAFGGDDKTSADDPGSWDTGVDSLSDQSAGFPYNSYRFNSGRISTTSNNLDMGFRTYDPNTDNFLSRDSYVGAAADAGLAADPYNADRYGFVGGNPISNIEQDGHGWLSTAAGIAGGIIGYGLCNAALDAETAGAGIAICAGIVGGALGGAASQGVSCAQGGSCSGASFAESAGIGAVSGLVTAGAAMGLGGLLPDALNSTVSGAIEGAGGGAAGGAAGYGAGCALGQGCSWAGLAASVGLGAGLGGALGAAGGALSKSGAGSSEPSNEQIIDKITTMLKARTTQAASDYDSGTATLTPGEIRSAANPRTAKAARGNYIDRTVKEYAANDPFLSSVVYMAENFEPLPDFFNVDLAHWWDMTTPDQWDQHVNDYENEFGTGIPLFTR